MPCCIIISVQKRICSTKYLKKKPRQLADTFLSRVDESLPFLEKIKCFIEAHFDLLTANPELPLFIYREILTNECGKEIAVKPCSLISG